jgi:sugar lactone lactonase YvrE
VDAAGNTVIADSGDNRIRAVAATTGTFYGQHMTAGDIYTVAGTGVQGFSGNGQPATSAKLTGAEGVTVSAAGNLVIADTGNNRIRAVAATTGTFYGLRMTAGDIYPIAGAGTAGYAGDGGRAASARLKAPAGVAADAAGNLVVADSGNNVIRVVAATTGTFYGQQMTAGDIYTIAGTGSAGYTGDGGAATTATLYYPQGVTVDAAGNLVVADTGNNVIRVVAATTGTFYGQQMTAGDIYTIAGTGTLGFSGDGGQATSAGLAVPAGAAVDGPGNVVIADFGDNRVRVVAATTGTFYGQQMTAGDIYTIAGTGAPGFSGDGGQATAGTLYYPQGVALDRTGDVLVTDSGNGRVRMITGSSPAATASPAGLAPARAHTRGQSAGRHATRASGPATAGPYVTLLFSRSEITAADGCVPDDSGIARLDTVVAPYLQSLGMTATGTLATGVTQATAPNCVHYNDSLSASWADAASMAKKFGWSFVSHTATYPAGLANLTPTQSYAQTCGSAASLDAHGFPGGHGLIAYPGAQASPLTLQTRYGGNCFAWGRVYNKSGMTPAASGSTPPYWQDTVVDNGGACNVTTASCYTVPAVTGGHPRYVQPSTIIAQIHALQPGQWFTLQSYLLVTGSSPGYSHDADRWDCTSSNPALHWTNDNERYCYSDWQQIVSAIAAMPGITVTDPLTVGVAFGRPATYP